MEHHKSDPRPICPYCGRKSQACLCPKAHDRTPNAPVVVPGDVVDSRYRIIKRLGRGASATVFLVENLPTQKLFAMKMMNKPVVHSDDASVKRFEREARALGSLNHPSLVALYDYGISSDGHPYFITDYVQGKTLAQVLAEEKVIPAMHSCELFAQVCEALDYAHKNGMIHRDLKPSNIMLVDSVDGKEIVKLVDFGIVKLVGPSDEEREIKLTQEGIVLGSPGYMSPEQCRGLELDPRSDVYSLGCVMYEALCGKPVFEAPYPMAILVKQVSESAPKMTTRNPALQIEPKLEDIVMKALAKSPSDRYGSMSELRDQLLAIKAIRGIDVLI